ncbi:N-acetylmuramoyl-L-alanine amidase, partial [Clostridium tetani]
EAVEQYMPYIIESLKSKGYEVLDVTPPEANRSLADSLSYSINKAREFGADLFISCHANAFKITDSAMGGEVIFPPGDSVSRNYALDVCNVLKKNGFINRCAKPDTRGLAEMNGKVGCPAIILEPFFIDSKADVNNFNWVGGVKLGREIGKAINVIPNPYKPASKASISVDGGGTILNNKSAINLIIRDFSSDIDRIFGYIDNDKKASYAFDINPLNDNYVKLEKNCSKAIYKRNEGYTFSPNTNYKVRVEGYKNGKVVTKNEIVLKTLDIEDDKLYRVQVGAFKDKDNADKLRNELKNKGFNGFIKE